MRMIRDDSEKIEKETICQNCGACIGYLPLDIKEKTETDYTGGKDIVKTIKCPKCNKEIRL